MIFGLVLIFVIWVQYEIRKTKKLSQKSSDEFWNREYNSNFSRSIDISGLNYIVIPIEQLPMMDQEDPSLNSYRNMILDLSNNKILDLNGMTNTDMKANYGIANYKFLSQCDTNYTILIRTLYQWGSHLYSNGLISEAITVLEYAVTCYTDASMIFRLLANIYKDQALLSKIDRLIEVIPKTKLMKKESFIHELLSIKNS